MVFARCTVAAFWIEVGWGVWQAPGGCVGGAVVDSGEVSVVAGARYLK